MIEFKRVSKVYDNGTQALDDVSISIDKGEFVFVVGASGAGKSTFLKLLLREEVPSSGSIRVMDYNLSTLPKKKIPYFRRNMGIVFQDFRLIPTMTVYDNVAFAMRVIGTKEAQIRKRVPFVLNLVGLANKARSYPLELSGGEQQRVAIARAMSMETRLMLADEPTGNLDTENSRRIIDLLLKLAHEDGYCVVVVTHDPEISARADKTYRIRDGVLYEETEKDRQKP